MNRSPSQAIVIAPGVHPNEAVLSYDRLSLPTPTVPKPCSDTPSIQEHSWRRLVVLFAEITQGERLKPHTGMLEIHHNNSTTWGMTSRCVRVCLSNFHQAGKHRPRTTTGELKRQIRPTPYFNGLRPTSTPCGLHSKLFTQIPSNSQKGKRVKKNDEEIRTPYRIVFLLYVPTHRAK